MYRLENLLTASPTAVLPMRALRNEVRADLVDRTECLERKGKEMIVEGDFTIFLFALGRRVSC